MSFPKIVAFTAFSLFAFIFVISKFKKAEGMPPITKPQSIEIVLEPETIKPFLAPPKPIQKQEPSKKISKVDPSSLDQVNRIEELFNKGEPKLPIVETITYKSRTSWQKGRPAWLADYASHYQTSRHFIARSLNGKPEYFKQALNEGDKFNVFREDKKISFYLLADLSLCKMAFYYIDHDLNERVLLKTYAIGCGRKDQSKASGLLTPLGKYELGDRVVIYKPKMFGYHQGEKTEMIRVFGSRWIPFEKEIEGCTEPAKGLGIHGVPWVTQGSQELVPDESSIGKYESDGCIRLSNEDVEELFSIVITKPTTIEIVQDMTKSEWLRKGGES
jgi:hypothetical protein